MVIALLALGVRFAAPGWWLIIVFMTIGFVALAILAPLILATTLTAVFAPALRPRTLIALCVADIALLTFASTLPDFTDVSDQYPVSLAALATGEAEVSRQAMDVFSAIAGYALPVYAAAALVTIVLAVLDHRRARRVPVGPRPGEFGAPAVWEGAVR
ncbi:hypothetical protein [Nocardia crassostreae]|uniref:hypothetical protein n=1 Tax=Nocardia crassostreae TaxID=53428 RepID=UPI000835D16D|nr:hypothetical protein [Nocardia crassostreae]